MVLVDWRPCASARSSVGQTIVLPNGLEIAGVAVFEKAGRRWAAMPAQTLSFAGAPVLGANGRQKWATPIRWTTSDLQRRFSEAVLELVERDGDIARRG